MAQPPNRHQAQKAGDKRESRERQVRKALHRVAEALDKGHRRDAVRLFDKIMSAGITPANRSLTRWMSGVLGKETMAKLVDAFVHASCFYCKTGRIPCDDCDAKGHLEDGTPCRTCVALGIARCDFCDGTGWGTLEHVPEDLRPAVLKNRFALALERMKKLLSRTIPRMRSDDPGKTVKRCSKLLIMLDRQMGVFENTYVAFQGLSESDQAKRKLDSVIKKCIRAGAKGEVRIQEILRRMADTLCPNGTARAAESEQPSHADQKAAFYASLVEPNGTLDGTGLEHPFLHRGIREAAKNKPAGRDSTSRTAKRKKRFKSEHREKTRQRSEHGPKP